MQKTQNTLDQILQDIRTTLDLNLIEYTVIPNWKPLSDHGTVYEYGVILRDHDRESLADVYGIDPGAFGRGYALSTSEESFCMWDWYTAGAIVIFNTWND